jgi:hypothetical protein
MATAHLPSDKPSRAMPESIRGPRRARAVEPPSPPPAPVLVARTAPRPYVVPVVVERPAPPPPPSQAPMRRASPPPLPVVRSEPEALAIEVEWADVEPDEVPPPRVATPPRSFPIPLVTQVAPQGALPRVTTPPRAMSVAALVSTPPPAPVSAAQLPRPKTPPRPTQPMVPPAPASRGALPRPSTPAPRPTTQRPTATAPRPTTARPAQPRAAAWLRNPDDTLLPLLGMRGQRNDPTAPGATKVFTRSRRVRAFAIGTGLGALLILFLRGDVGALVDAARVGVAAMLRELVHANPATPEPQVASDIPTSSPPRIAPAEPPRIEPRTSTPAVAAPPVTTAAPAVPAATSVPPVQRAIPTIDIRDLPVVKRSGIRGGPMATLGAPRDRGDDSGATATVTPNDLPVAPAAPGRPKWPPDSRQ